MKSKNTARILFIGNSYTQRNNLPGLVEQLAASATPQIQVNTERVIANGASLRRHWNAGEALQAIEGSQWDFVVLQEQSTLPIKNPVRFHENVRLFDEAIKQSGAKTVLYLTWARANAPATQGELNSATRNIAEETGSLVVPVGVAWEQALHCKKAPELYDPDDSHPSLAGSYLAACVFARKLCNVNLDKTQIPATVQLSPDEAALLHRIAQEACST